MTDKKNHHSFLIRSHRSRFTNYDDPMYNIIPPKQDDNKPQSSNALLKLSCSILAIFAISSFIFFKTDGFKKIRGNLKTNNTIITVASSLSSLELFEKINKYKDSNDSYIDKDTKKLFNLAIDKNSKFVKVKGSNEITIVGKGLFVTGNSPEKFLRMPSEEINIGDVFIISQRGFIYKINKEIHPLLTEFINLLVDDPKNGPALNKLEEIFLMAKVKKTPIKVHKRRGSLNSLAQ